jgi:hypothetical protein
VLLVKAKKHNEGYLQGYEGEQVSLFEYDVLCLKSAFREAILVLKFGHWRKKGEDDLKALRAHLEVIKNSDMFCAAGVVFMVEILDWSHPPPLMVLSCHLLI